MRIRSTLLTALLLAFALSVESSAESPQSEAWRTILHDLENGARRTISDAAYVYSSPLRIDRSDVLWFGGWLAVGASLYALDREIYEGLQRNRDHELYKPIRKTGEFFEPAALQGKLNKVVVGALVAGYLTGIDSVTETSADLIEQIIVSGGPKNLTMILVGRNGPSQDKGPRSFESNRGRSFPSGHSLTAMHLAATLSHHVDYKPFTVLAYTIAGTVLLQRVTSDAHWPSDVYAGASLGLMISRCMLKRADERRLSLSPTLIEEGEGIGLSIRCPF